MSVMYSILEVLAFAMQYPLWKIRPNLFPLKCVGILLMIQVAKIKGPACWIYTKSHCWNSAGGCDRRWCLGEQTRVLQPGLSEMFQNSVFITWTAHTRQPLKTPAHLQSPLENWASSLCTFWRHVQNAHKQNPENKAPRQLAAAELSTSVGSLKMSISSWRRTFTFTRLLFTK